MKSKSKFGKINLIIIAILALSAIGLKIWQYHWPEAELMLSGEPLHVLVAKTPYHQYRGLGKRDSLEEYDGMLFIFDLPKKPVIVMREMRFPIDIVWLKYGEVVDIAPNAQVEEVSEEELTPYYPRTDANLVLELPAGWAEEHGLKIGDVLTVVSE